MWIRGSVLGLTVLDIEGAPVGRVQDTYPRDGSSPEFVVIAERFGERLLVSLNGARKVDAQTVQVPFSRLEIDEAPSPDSGRYHFERLSVARAYWTQCGGEHVGAKWSR